jgi:chromosome segregation ATPase
MTFSDLSLGADYAFVRGRDLRELQSERDALKRERDFLAPTAERLQTRVDELTRYTDRLAAALKACGTDELDRLKAERDELKRQQEVLITQRKRYERQAFDLAAQLAEQTACNDRQGATIQEAWDDRALALGDAESLRSELYAVQQQGLKDQGGRRQLELDLARAKELLRRLGLELLH